ncbi:MAG: hypothetical protein CEN89_685 [Candidatus Berkelbacteria bacterium Licking1014_7]|uniref:Uncharacterized protein n=1 Tax=Candidatus Berkelbacteria bacterium Licking1014_7 TaxID=2017147 RepID=A0A554LHY5_9BACT|nr:MAG: hypothetical protein CEN89_685 [Candidatus Berkelbacteria bacterium Licking1014_7]
MESEKHIYWDEKQEKQQSSSSLEDEADYHNQQIDRIIKRYDGYIKNIEASDVPPDIKAKDIEKEKRECSQKIENYLDWQHFKSEKPMFNTDLPERSDAEVLEYAQQKIHPLELNNKYARDDDALWLHSRFFSGFRKRDCSYLKYAEIKNNWNILEHLQTRAGDQYFTPVINVLNQLLQNVNNQDYSTIYSGVGKETSALGDREPIRVYRDSEDGEEKFKDVWNISIDDCLSAVTGISKCSKKQFIAFCEKEMPSVELLTQRGFNALLNIAKILTQAQKLHYGKATSYDIGLVFNENLSRFVGDKNSPWGSELYGGAQPVVEGVILPVSVKDPEHPSAYGGSLQESMDENTFGRFMFNYYTGLYSQIMYDLFSNGQKVTITPAYDMYGNIIWPEVKLLEHTDRNTSM